MFRWTLAPLLFAPAFADDVFLKNGAAIHGSVVRQTESVVTIEIGAGTIEIERHLVRRIVRDESSVLQDFRARLARIENSSDAMEFWKLADWCETNGVSKEVRRLIDRAIQLDREIASIRPPDLILKLRRSGISDAFLKTLIAFRAISIGILDKDRAHWLERGLGQDLYEWLVLRETPPPEPKVPEPPAEFPKPSPPPPKRAPEPSYYDPMQQFGFPPGPYHTIIINSYPYPYGYWYLPYISRPCPPVVVQRSCPPAKCR